MKNKSSILILLLIVAITISIFCGCTNDRAYLIEGSYECENVNLDSLKIDKIAVDLEDISETDYDRYAPHIILYSDKAFSIALEIWIDGERKEIYYDAHYEFKLNQFFIGVEYDGERFIIDFVTELNGENEYSLKGNIQLESSKAIPQEIIFKSK